MIDRSRRMGGMEGRIIVWGGIIVKVIDVIYDVGNGKIRLFKKFIKV